jgi:hypothetical protein
MHPIFFVEYSAQVKNQVEKDAKDHENRAESIRAVWMAVKDLDAARKAYDRMGLTPCRPVVIASLGAKGCEIKAASGVILLLTAAKPDGAVGQYLNQRGDSVMGISLEVANLTETSKV